jgi:hypothetical protein
MAFKKTALLTVTTLVLNLCTLAGVDAASLNVSCQVGGGGSRSSIKVRGAGLKGNYYVRVFSGENIVKTEEKLSGDNGVIEFRFDSALDFIANNPSTIEIAPNFIKKRAVVGVLRKGGSRARVGAVRAKCSVAKT